MSDIDTSQEEGYDMTIVMADGSEVPAKGLKYYDASGYGIATINGKKIKYTAPEGWHNVFQLGYFIADLCPTCGKPLDGNQERDYGGCPDCFSV